MVSYPWIITGDVLAHHWLGEGSVRCVRGLYLIHLGRSADGTEGNITLHTGRHADTLVCSQMSSVWSGITKENSTMISECVPEPPTKPGWSLSTALPGASSEGKLSSSDPKTVGQCLHIKRVKHFCTCGNHYPQGEQAPHHVTDCCLCCVTGARAAVHPPNPLPEQHYGPCFQILQSQGCTECCSASKSPLREKKNPVSLLPCPAGLLPTMLSNAAGHSLEARCSLAASDMAHFTLMDTKGHFKRSFRESLTPEL